MEQVVLPTLGTLTSDPDVDVRRHGAQLLVEFLSTVDAKWGTELLAVGSSILQQGLYLATRSKPEDRVNSRKSVRLPAYNSLSPSLLQSGEAPQLPDSKALVLGLIKVFKVATLKQMLYKCNLLSHHCHYFCPGEAVLFISHCCSSAESACCPTAPAL